MGERGKARGTTARSEIDFCLRAHQGLPKGDSTSPDHFDTLYQQDIIGVYSVHQHPLDPKASIDAAYQGREDNTARPPDLHDEVLEFFAQGQSLVSPTNTLGFHLLDEAFPPHNPSCPPEAVEDDYSEDSRP